MSLSKLNPDHFFSHGFDNVGGIIIPKCWPQVIREMIGPVIFIGDTSFFTIFH